MFRFAQHDTLERRRQCAAACLFEQWPARFLKRRVRDHDGGWRIGRSGVIHPLHFRPERCVFGLRSSDIDWSPDAYQRVKFCCRFTMQTNAAMRVRSWMDIALMKTVGGSKLAPITHWISDVTARAVTSDIQWVIGASLLPPTVFIRAISIQLRTRMAAFVCMVKRQQNFTRWYASGLQSISLLRSPKTQRSGRKCNGWMTPERPILQPPSWSRTRRLRNRAGHCSNRQAAAHCRLRSSVSC